MGDIDPQSLSQMISDCHKFQTENAEALDASNHDDSMAGYLFWLNRNRHGHGFWSYEDEWADYLHEASHSYCECSLYVGDDCRIHYYAG